jgi:hypothetical protein
MKDKNMRNDIMMYVAIAIVSGVVMLAGVFFVALTVYNKYLK